MNLTEKKKEELLGQIAKELRKKHDLELYKECLGVGTRIYEMAKEGME